MNTIHFDSGRAALDLPTLQNTVRYEMANGKLPRNRPIEHFQLIGDLCELADRHGLEPEPGAIHATERQAMRINWKGEPGECPVNHFLIQRLLTNIDLKKQDEHGRNMGIALGYHERGITLAFGVNVWACSNMQIFGEHVLRTHGRHKMRFDEMWQEFTQWMEQFPERRDFQINTIEELSNFEISTATLDETVGELFRLAVNENEGKQVHAPLNQLQVADLVRAMQEEVYRTDRPLSAYDLVQYGTHWMKPHRSDLVTLIDHNNEFCDFVTERFTG